MFEDGVLYFFVQFVDEAVVTCLLITLLQKNNQTFLGVLCEKAEGCAGEFREAWRWVLHSGPLG